MVRRGQRRADAGTPHYAQDDRHNPVTALTTLPTLQDTRSIVFHTRSTSYDLFLLSHSSLWNKTLRKSTSKVCNWCICDGPTVSFCFVHMDRHGPVFTSGTSESQSRLACSRFVLVYWLLAHPPGFTREIKWKISSVWNNCVTSHHSWVKNLSCDVCLPAASHSFGTIAHCRRNTKIGQQSVLACQLVIKKGNFWK